jgi:hypothetical protein
VLLRGSPARQGGVTKSVVLGGVWDSTCFCFVGVSVECGRLCWCYVIVRSGAPCTVETDRSLRHRSLAVCNSPRGSLVQVVWSMVAIHNALACVSHYNPISSHPRTTREHHVP